MYSALLRPHRMLGLLLSPTSVRFARATGSARSGSVQDHGAADIPKAPELLDPASIDTALQSLASSVTTGSAVSVCLPPQAVYYAVAPTNAASVSATLDTLIPEPPDSLAVQTAPLKKHAGDRTSVIALRSDLLKHRPR